MWKGNSLCTEPLASEEIYGLIRLSSRFAMARYTPVDTQPKFVAIDLAAQLRPRTFEHARHHLLE